MNTANNAAASARPLSLAEARKAYLQIRGRSEARTRQEFDAEVKTLLAAKGIETPSPEQYVQAARRAAFRCGRCAGTGSFVTRVENGKPCGPGGACFRCAGKGRQTDADVMRNAAHDRHAFAAAAHAMAAGR